MGSMLVYGLVIIAYIIGLIASIAIIVHAFQEGEALQGILCLFIPSLPAYLYVFVLRYRQTWARYCRRVDRCHGSSWCASACAVRARL